MATLTLSSAWTQGGQSKFEVAAGNLHDVLKGFAAAQPQFASRILGANGEPFTFYNIYINDEAIQRSARASTVVADGDEITIVPPLAGG